MAAAAIAVGAGISMISSYNAGIDKENAYELEASSRRAQSNEVQIGANREIQLTQQHYAQVKGAQEAAIGSSGTTMSGTNLMQLETSARNAYDQISSIQQAANFRSGTLLTDAEQSGVLGQQAYNAGIYGAVGAGINGYGNYARATKGGI